MDIDVRTGWFSKARSRLGALEFSLSIFESVLVVLVWKNESVIVQSYLRMEKGR